MQVDWIKECLAKRQFIEEIGRFECDSIANEDGKKGTIREWKRCHLKKVGLFPKQAILWVGIFILHSKRRKTLNSLRSS